MKAIIFHGTDCKPSDYWYQWLGKELEQAGYEVDIPYYQDINHTLIDEFLPNVLKDLTLDEETILVGHSAGEPLILSVLENVNTRVSRAVLVAGFSTGFGRRDTHVLQSEYNWPVIKSNARDFVFINSTNDPWQCDDKQGRIMFDHLGGTQIIRNEGHFGSKKFEQPYPTFELLKSIVLEPVHES